MKRFAVPDYAELWCLSNFSFLRGASFPEELVARAHQLGYKAIALTDECTMSGIVRAHVEAKERGMRLLVGAQFEVSPGAQVDVPFTLVITRPSSSRRSSTASRWVSTRRVSW